VVAPGPADRPLQLVDARDLAAWMVRCAESGVTGAYDTVSPPGHTTIGELLEVCREVTGGAAELVWRTPEELAAVGVTGWTDLPIWTPPTGELAVLHDSDTSRAAAAGLTVRPVRETVTDTWAWLSGLDEEPFRIPGRGVTGLTAEQTQSLLP
jgi:nucleoside-diphosphate-sugar epimerase